MPKELTGKQINQQDVVDNAIYECVNSILPPDMLKRFLGQEYKAETEDFDPDLDKDTNNIEWDQNWIGEVRDSIFENLMRYFNIPESEHEKMLMDFYPYIKE